MIQTIPAADLGRRLRAGEKLNLIDVRSPAEFASGHAAGAVSLPVDALSVERVRALCSPGPLFVICRSGVRSARACQQLVEQELGAEPISVAGGTQAWMEAGLPMVMPGVAPEARLARPMTDPSGSAPGACAIGARQTAGPAAATQGASAPAGALPSTGLGGADAAVASRVRTIAGSLVLLGAVLGFGVHPAFHGLSAAVGLGLVYAGLSGTCMMETVLGRLAGSR